MANAQSRFVGEIPKIIYNRNMRSSQNLLTSLMQAHSAESTTEVALPPIPNEAIAEAQRSVPLKRSLSQIESIQRAVLTEYPGVCLNDIRSRRRTDKIVRPRQVAMYLATALTARTLPDIGRRMGGRDHTTVLHARDKIERLIQIDPVLAEKVERIKVVFEEMMA